MNAGESHEALLSLELEYASTAAGFGALLPWMTKGLPFEVGGAAAIGGTKDAAPAEGGSNELALAALQLSERLVRQFFDDSPIGVAVFDAAGRLLHFNRAFGAMLGLPAAELSERNIEELVHPDDAPAIQERRRRLIDGACDSFQVEMRFATAKGREVWTRMIGRLERPGGDRPPHIFAHIVELPELKHTHRSPRDHAEEVRVKDWDPERYM